MSAQHQRARGQWSSRGPAVILQGLDPDTDLRKLARIMNQIDDDVSCGRRAQWARRLQAEGYL